VLGGAQPPYGWPARCPRLIFQLEFAAGNISEERPGEKKKGRTLSRPALRSERALLKAENHTAFILEVVLDGATKVVRLLEVDLPHANGNMVRKAPVESSADFPGEAII